MRRLPLPRAAGGDFWCDVDPDPQFGRLEHFLTRDIAGRRKYVLIDPLVLARFPALARILENDATLVLPTEADEHGKTLAQCGSILERILGMAPTRQDVVVAIGGGALMNVGGVVAGLLLRGVDLVLVPTTLTGQTDVFLGGKQAVNLLGFKNQIGLYHDPAYVYVGTAFLRTLGLGRLKIELIEGLKLCLARSAEDYWDIVGSLDTLDLQELEKLAMLVERLIRLKADVVRIDPFELRSGASLLYGHEVGHALESASDYTISHCEAVGLGMLTAARVAHLLGLCDSAHVEVHRELLCRVGIASRIGASIPAELILRHVEHDKKREHGRTRFVLTRRVGELVSDAGEYFHAVDDRVIRSAVLESY